MSNFNPRSADSGDLFSRRGVVRDLDRYAVVGREGAKHAHKGALGALKSPNGHRAAEKKPVFKGPAKRARPRAEKRSVSALQGD